MKYIRFIDKAGLTCIGSLTPDGRIDLLDGDILDSCKPTGRTCSVADIKQYLPPVDPPNIIALGLNYAEHAREGGFELPPAPVIFIKATTALNAHEMPIVLPLSAPDEVDYEAELAVVIGKKARHVSPAEAPDYILGYTCGNDVSARDCQMRFDKQWARAKSFDTFAPLGPVIETELDPGNLKIRSILNGKCMQDGCTSDLIFGVPDIVSYISKNMTLLPGTVIFTGTPSGVGVARKPPVFLRPNDKIVIEIEGIGSLANDVIAEA